MRGMLALGRARRGRAARGVKKAFGFPIRPALESLVHSGQELWHC
jgi:hypothetical protein